VVLIKTCRQDSAPVASSDFNPHFIPDVHLPRGNFLQLKKVKYQPRGFQPEGAKELLPK
jgi:hypothetical protein